MEQTKAHIRHRVAETEKWYNVCEWKNMQHAIHTIPPDTYEISHFHLLTHILMKDDDEEEQRDEEKKLHSHGGPSVIHTKNYTCNVSKVLAQVVT